MLRIGYKASAEQFTPSELLQFCVLAEQLDFDSVFISDHFQPWRHTGGHAPYSFGEIRSPMNELAGCRLRGRCPLAQPICAELAPLREIGPGRLVARHLA